MTKYSPGEASLWPLTPTPSEINQMFGTIIHGTLRTEDLLAAFADELEARGGDAKLIAEARAIDPDDEHALDVLSELEDNLQEYAPEYGYFGAHPGDGSDFGYWLCDDWVSMAKEDGVIFVDDLASVPGRKICVVNDHGNATLYYQDSDMKEIWSVV